MSTAAREIQLPGPGPSERASASGCWRVTPSLEDERAQGFAGIATAGTAVGDGGIALRPAGVRESRLDVGLRMINKCIDRMGEDVADESRAVGSGDVQQVDKAIRRLQATKLALIAKADRQEVRRRSGATSTAAWVAGLTTSGGGGAARDVLLATALDQSLPTTKAAFGAGEVSHTSAGIIADTMTRLPEGLTAQDRARIESALVNQGRRLEPGKLRRVATAALAAAEKSAAEVAQHQEDLLADQERRAYARSSITMHDHGDGTTSGRFLLPTGSAQVLRKVLQTMTAPRRNHLHKSLEARLADGQTAAGDFRDGSIAAGLRVSGRRGTSVGATDATGATGALEGWAATGGALTDQTTAASARSGPITAATFSTDPTSAAASSTHSTSAAAALHGMNDWESLSWAEKRGRAFAQLLEHLPTDKLTGKVASTVVVTVTLEQVVGAARAADLAALTKASTCPTKGNVHRSPEEGHRSLEEGPAPSTGAARTDYGHLHSTSEARRLACNAGILPLVLGGSSVPLDLGRKERFFTDAQRLALSAVYEECAAEGCDRPYAWSELHHEDPWSQGGETTLTKAVPLCGHHHRRVHDAAYAHRISTVGKGKKSVHFRLRK